MNQPEIRDVFDHHGVLQKGHFKLSSGRHSDTYLQCQRVLEHPRVTRSLAGALAQRFADAEVDLVLSPAVGAILIGSALADAFDARFVFAERVDGAMTLRRGQVVHRGERVVVCEDVVTTGGSAAECVELAKDAGATVVGVASLVDRATQTLPFRLESLLRADAAAWEPAECPMCARGEPIDAPGSRALRA
jgi:orotate phosphoribosyltransferase